MSLLHKLTGGVPRLVNFLCDRSLLGAYARNERFVVPATVQAAAAEALGDLAVRRKSPFRIFRDRRRWTVTEFVLAALIVGVCVWWWFTRPKAEEPAPAAATTPVPVAIATPAPAPTVAAPPESRLSDVLDNSEPLGIVTGHLIHLWSPGLALPPGEKVCPALA